MILSEKMTKNIGEGDSEADMKPLKSNATTESLDSETPAAILLRWTPDELRRPVPVPVYNSWRPNEMDTEFLTRGGPYVLA